MTAWAWVAVSLSCSTAGQVGQPGGINRVRALRAPDRPPGGQPQGGPALAGEFRAAGEGAGQFLLRRQAGDSPVMEATSSVSWRSSRILVIRVSVSARRRLVWRRSSSSVPSRTLTRSSAPGRWAITRLGRPARRTADARSSCTVSAGHGG
jgi:hypothetical protein